MTLIASVCTRLWVIQASDRLVTRGGRPFDDNANKAVLFEARNGILAIGYSGTAFLDDVPTDQWIADRLYSIQWQRTNGRRVVAGARMIPDVGQTIPYLRTQLREGLRRLQRPLPLHVAIAGWQWPKDKPMNARPILYEIDTSADPSRELGGLTRWWFVGDKSPSSFSSLVPPPQTTSVLRKFGKRVEGASKETVISEILSLMRHAARSSRVVSANCQIVVLHHPRTEKGEVTYAPVRGERSTITFDTLTDDAKQERKTHVVPVESAYSPWIVSKGVVAPPMLVVGGFTVQFGPISLEVKGSQGGESEGGSVNVQGGFFPITRPKSPKLGT